MKLSIIVPVYNVEPYLHRCVDSILAQTFQDFELILVDDGSPDGCPAICDAYAQADSRVRVIHKSNGGLSDARNAGLDIARGEYIGFVDSDDHISPTMYQRLLELVLRNHADIAATGYIEVLPDGREVSRSHQLETELLLSRADFIDNFFPDNKRIIAACVWNKVYRKQIFSDLRFPAGRIYEDSFLQLPILDRCKTVVVSTEHDYYYQIKRPGSIMNSKFSQKYFLNMDFILEQHTYFRKRRNTRQQAYALDTYLGKYLLCYFGVYLENPKLKKVFQPYQKEFRSHLAELLLSPQIIKMKKLIVLFLFINRSTAYHLTRKYFPEYLIPQLRYQKEDIKCISY